jgi:hypothetical protein
MSVSWMVREARFSDEAGNPAAARMGLDLEVSKRVMIPEPAVEVKPHGPLVRRL